MTQSFRLWGRLTPPVLVLASLLWFRPVALGRAGFVPGEVLVKLKSSGRGLQLQGLTGLPAGARVKRHLPLAGWQLVQLPPGMAVQDGVARFRARPDVVAAEPNHRYELHVLPNDPQVPRLYGLERIGAPQAWDTTTGSADVVVAVFDTGVDYTHPDLTPNMWRNPGEVPDDQVDDDGNGYVDDVFGVNVRDGNGDPMDDAGHGTHVAGTIGAAGNNAAGVTGVCWNVRLMAVRVGAVDGFSDTAEIMDAFEYAVSMKRRGVNVRVINCSWGGGFPSQALREAICVAGQANILVVCSAGNEHQDNDLLPQYPVGYDCAALLRVAASTVCDEPASFSNWGALTVDLAAPGNAILSTYKGGALYALFSGTSMSAPHVSGAAALLLARKPELTAVELRALILGTVDPVPSWQGKVLSGGRLNLANAMRRLVDGAPIVVPPARAPVAASRLTSVSRSSTGAWGDGPSTEAVLSADGRFVAFASTATNLVPGDVEGKDDIFLRDRTMGTTVRVSQTPAGIGAAADCRTPAISPDGSLVAFVTPAGNLVTGDNNAVDDVLLWHRETQVFELVSVRPVFGGAGNAPSDSPALSADGRFVAFASDASNLVGGDSNGGRDVFVRDRSTRTTERVSVAGTNTEALGHSDAPSLSADGRWVAFHSGAPNLVADDENQVFDAFVRDRVEQRTVRVSVGSGGTPPGTGDSVFPIISADGRWVLFHSLADNLDSHPADEFLAVFLHDRTEQKTTRVSTAPSGAPPSGDSYADSLSADGRFALFTSDDSTLYLGGPPALARVFVFDRLAGTLGPLPWSDAGYAPEDTTFLGKVNADGRFIVLNSYGFNLVPGDGNGTLDAFVLDRGTAQADLTIRAPGITNIIGEGIANPNFLQKVTRELAAGESVAFEIGVINGGLESRSFVLNTAPSPAGWRILLYDAATGGSEITSAMTGAGWSTPPLGPGARLPFRAEVGRLDNSTGEPVFESWITVRAGSGQTALDAVRAVTTTGLPAPGFRLVSRGLQAQPAGRSAEVAAVSSDGARIVFSSNADNLTPDRDTNVQADVFLVDRTSGTLEILSAGPQGQGDADSLYPTVSRDGRRVAFQSRSANLAEEDTNEVEDVFVREIETGEITRVSVPAEGGQANHASENAVVSGNGALVAFHSFADNLVLGDTNGTMDVFLRDLDRGTIECISRAPAGPFGNADSEMPVMSGDGRFVVFTSFAGNLGAQDTNGFADVYLVDRIGRTVELVSANPAGRAADGPSGGPSISDDGRWIGFFSYGSDLAPGAPFTESRAYLLDRQTRILAPIESLVGGLPAGLQPRRAMVSPDGRWLAIAAANTRCAEGVTPYAQLYLFDRVTAILAPVSDTRAGQLGDEHSILGGFSADGRYLVFESWARNLLGEATWLGGAGQVFLADLARFQTDSLVQRERGSPWRGEGTALPDAQSVEVPLAVGVAHDFRVQIRNPAAFPDRFVIRGSGDQTGLLAIQYLGENDSLDVTSAITGAGWQTPELASGANLVLTVRVTARNPAPGLPRLQVIAVSASDPDRIDIVQLVVQPDSDADTLPDPWERNFFGTLTVADARSDSDADGVSDLDEYIAATNPEDPQSRLGILSAQARGMGGIELSWLGTSGRYYGVERSSGLTAPFESITNKLAGAAGPILFLDAGAGAAAPAFYRVRAELP